MQPRSSISKGCFAKISILCFLLLSLCWRKWLNSTLIPWWLTNLHPSSNGSFQLWLKTCQRNAAASRAEGCLYSCTGILLVERYGLGDNIKMQRLKIQNGAECGWFSIQNWLYHVLYYIFLVYSCLGCSTWCSTQQSLPIRQQLSTDQGCATSLNHLVDQNTTYLW